MKRFKLIGGATVVLALLGVFIQHTDAQTIAGAEYFIDEDPGEGMAIPMEAADGLYNSGTEEIQTSVDTSMLSVGSHLLGMRFLKSDGIWSYTRKTWFDVSGQPTLMGAEWFIDSDPGKGKGHPVALPVDGVWDEAEEQIDINDIDVSQLSVNSEEDPNGHTVFVRFLDSDGNWGLARRAVFQVVGPVHIAAAKWSTEPIDPVAQPNSGNAMQAEDGTFDEASEGIVATGVTLPAGCSTVYVRAQDSRGRWSTFRGYYLDASGQWKFDPAKAYPPGSQIEFCYSGAGAMGSTSEGRPSETTSPK
jgi:hypothetical protein